MSATDERTQLRRLRWLVVTGLALGIAGTTAANVLHAQPSLPARIISAWAPLTLLLVLEVIARAPTPRQWWVRIVVWLMVAVLGSGAAFVSYRHMVAVALRYGEDEIAAHLLPVLVDGLVVVMSAFLVDLSARIRELAASHAAALPAAAGQPAQHLPGLPDDPGIDAIAHLGTLRLFPPDLAIEAPAAGEPAEELPEPEPLLPGIRAALGHLPTPPGRIRVQGAALDLGESIGSPRADRIVGILKAGPWPPARPAGQDLPAPALAGQTA